MPELPEVETVCRGLFKKINNLKVLDVQLINKKLRYNIEPKKIRKIINKKVKGVIRRGKNGIILFSNNLALNFHLGMTGKFIISEREIVLKKHDHLVIEFNKKMNYSDVESKLSIIDNSSSSVIGFMPVWNNKTLHLVVDTDNGTSSTVESNPLTSGRTYKVSLLGSAKDSDGNALGSDVVKYITP